MKINFKEIGKLIIAGMTLGLENESIHTTNQIAKLNEYGGNNEQNNKDDKQ